jgi:hypothetical protein
MMPCFSQIFSARRRVYANCLSACVASVETTRVVDKTSLNAAADDYNNNNN